MIKKVPAAQEVIFLSYFKFSQRYKKLLTCTGFANRIKMEINSFRFEGKEIRRPFVIAGPCSAESEDQMIGTARLLASQGVEVFRAGIWKPRTKPGGFEGVGSAGLEWLKIVKEETGLKTTTEVANSRHVEDALKAGVDIFWIGARTTANPFAVQEIAEAAGGSGTPVLVKNPINPDIELWIGAAERLIACGTDNIAFVHRGFGAYEKGLFRNQPQWHIPIELKRRLPSVTILCDPSHIGGKQNLIYPISQQAMDLGFDGLMIETHINPSQALSDKEQQITPELLERIHKLIVIRDTSESSEYLADLRREIDELDDRLLNILSKRMSVAREIGRYKMQNNMQVLQPVRYDKMVTSRIAQALGLELDEDFVKQILEAVHEESVRQQFEIINRSGLSQKLN